MFKSPFYYIYIYIYVYIYVYIYISSMYVIFFTILSVCVPRGVMKLCFSYTSWSLDFFQEFTVVPLFGFYYKQVFSIMYDYHENFNQV